MGKINKGIAVSAFLILLAILEKLDMLGGAWGAISPVPLVQQLIQWFSSWWPSMTINFLRFVLELCIIGLLVWILIALRQHQKDLGWLEDLARSDDEEMPNIVRLEGQNMSVASWLDVYDPHVVFQVPIFNGSIYDLTLEEKVEGQFFIEVPEGHTPLHDEPKIYQMPGRPKHIKAKRVRHFDVLIRQRIPQPTVDYIRSKGNAVFWASMVCVRFTYRNYTGTHKTLPIKITGLRASLKV